MSEDEVRYLLAEALWRIDVGTDALPLAQASPESHRSYARAATDLLPTVRAIAAEAYGQGRDDEAAGLSMREVCTCGEAWSGHPNPHASTCAQHPAANKGSRVVS